MAFHTIYVVSTWTHSIEILCGLMKALSYYISSRRGQVPTRVTMWKVFESIRTVEGLTIASVPCCSLDAAPARGHVHPSFRGWQKTSNYMDPRCVNSLKCPEMKLDGQCFHFDRMKVTIWEHFTIPSNTKNVLSHFWHFEVDEHDENGHNVHIKAESLNKLGARILLWKKMRAITVRPNNKLETTK